MELLKKLNLRVRKALNKKDKKKTTKIRSRHFQAHGLVSLLNDISTHVNILMPKASLYDIISDNT